MPEKMRFLPRAEVLTIAELDRLCTAFIGLGTRKLRLTGGEPLVRKGFMELVERLSRHLRSGALRELTLTTNGTQLARHAAELAHHGVRRINVSLDTLDSRRLRPPDPRRRSGEGAGRPRRRPGRRPDGEAQHRGASPATTGARSPRCWPSPTPAAST